jgi:hypothetical protein
MGMVPGLILLEPASEAQVPHQAAIRRPRAARPPIRRASSQPAAHDLALDVRQAEVAALAAVDELLVVEP